MRPLPLTGVRVIGERVNPTGKKRMQQALLEGDLDYAVSMAMQEAEAGGAVPPPAERKIRVYRGTAGLEDYLRSIGALEKTIEQLGKPW